MLRLLLIITILLVSREYLFSQKQNNIWYFGDRAGLDFNINPPLPISSPMYALEGCSVISDSAGQVLFFSNGITVWDRNHNVMPNGNDLLGGYSSSQAALIVPLPKSDKKFFLFTTDHQFSSGILAYSVIDLDLNGGYGDIIPETKNTILIDSVGEKVAAVLHSNGLDLWIVTHKLNSDEFLSYLLTPDGLNPTPVTSSIGSYYSFDNGPRGPIRVSHNGTRLVSSGVHIDVLEIFDFNAENGSVSNLYDLSPLFPNQKNFVGLEFSPNDSLLYVSSYLHAGYLYQIDLHDFQVTLLNSSNINAFGALQLGPDSNIYVGKILNQYIDVIFAPNLKGFACDYKEDVIKLIDGTLSNLGLPNLPPYALFSDTTLSPTLGDDQIGCSGIPLILNVDFPQNCFPVSYLWNNGSTGSELLVSEAGAYWIEITGTCGVFRDTIQIDFISCMPIVHYDLEECTAYMHNGTNMDYTEFIPSYPNQLLCSDVSANHVLRSPPQENKHSCTPGVDGSVAMCISSYNSCTYSPGQQSSLVIEVTIDPHSDSAVWLTGLEFFEKAPTMYSWIDGGSGSNNYPTLYGIRILKNGSEIYSEKAIPTSLEWTLQTYDFINNDAFRVEESTLFRIELLPYCPVGNGAEVSAWDIDEIMIFGGCISDEVPDPIVEGEVYTKDGKAIPEVEVHIAQNLFFDGFDMELTDEDGSYMFDSLEAGNSYFLRGYKNDDVRNGVSTLDLLHIQKHLLGKVPFTSLDQYIAADANHSDNVSAADLIEIRKLLLGIYTEFPENTSWRFGPLPQEMNGSDISLFNEVSSIESIQSDTHKIDFVGIKIGDLNGTVKLNSQAPDIQTRSADDFVLMVEDRELTRDKLISIDFKSEVSTDIAGLQFALELNDIEIISVTGSIIPITRENYSIIDGVFRLSWSSDEVLNILPGVKLFSIVVRSSKAGLFSNRVSVVDQLLKPEAYLENLQAVNLDLEIGNRESISGTKDFLKIEPNPVYSDAKIHFHLTEGGQTEICFFDLSGRLIHIIQKTYLPGEHNEIIKPIDFSLMRGVIYCQLVTNGFTIVEKFIAIKP